MEFPRDAKRDHAGHNSPKGGKQRGKKHGGDHQGHHAHVVGDFRRRFWVSLILTIPILALSPLIQRFLGLTEAFSFPGDNYVIFGFASAVYFYGGWPFLKGLFDEMGKRQPRIRADYEEVNLDTLYSRDEIVNCDEEQLRVALENLPCCTTNKRGTRNGDPLNLVFIGNVEDLLTALVGSGWDVTERMSLGSIWRTVRSSLFRKRYRHAPVSSLYVFGRRQEAAFQKARRTVDERNHFRVWLTPLRFEGKRVWIGQISSDIGVKFTLRTGFLVTHVIDPDVDNDRWYLVQNLADAEALTKSGNVRGVGKAPPDDPRYNLGGDPYFTDGLRAVMVCTKFPVSFSDVEFFDWEFPPDSENFRKWIVNRPKPLSRQTAQ